MRILAHVTLDGTIRPVYPEHLKRHMGRDVWVELHESPRPNTRSSDANRYYWGVVVRSICEETGCDPESCHFGLKREAVRLGILDPQYILLGKELVETEATTVTGVEEFKRYVDWVVDWARTKLGIHIEGA